MPDHNMTTQLYPKLRRKQPAARRVAPEPKPFQEVTNVKPPAIPKLMLANGEVMGRLWGADIWRVTGTGTGADFPEAPADGFTYGRKDAGWDRSLNLQGGTMTGFPLILARDPVQPLEAATRQWVEDLLTNDNYRGVWEADTNTPNLNLVTRAPNNGDRWLCDTSTGNPATVPAAPILPGLNGQLITPGDFIIWSDQDNSWGIVHQGGLTKPIADTLYLSLGGGTVTGDVRAPSTTAGATGTTLVTKDYVDARIFQNPVGPGGYGRTEVGGWLRVVDRGGDTMFGDFTLNRTPVAADPPLIAATKEYVDQRVGFEPVPGAGLWGRLGPAATSSWQRSVALSGDVMTGFLTLSADPTALAHAATKRYVDQHATDAAGLYVLKAGDTMTGELMLSSSTPSVALTAASRGYVDAQVATRLTQAQADARYVNLLGDTMTGKLTLLEASQTAPADAAPISLVDTRIAASALLHVARVGGLLGTMTGEIVTTRLTVAADPAGTLTTKSYVDAQAGGGTPLIFGVGLTETTGTVDLDIASAAQIATGTADDRAVTPLGLRSVIGAPVADLDTVEKTVVPAINELFARAGIAEPTTAGAAFGRSGTPAPHNWVATLPIAGGDLTGKTTMVPATETTDGPTTLATKGYVDARDLLDAASDGGLYGRRDGGWVLAVPLGGGVMSGLLTLAGDPVDPLHAVPLRFLEQTFTDYEAPVGGLVHGRTNTAGVGAWARAVATDGDTMTGPLILPLAAPTLPEHAANKAYVDAASVTADYRGLWNVETNSPDDLSDPANQIAGYRWLCVVASQTGASPPATPVIPGLPSTMILYDGDWVIWDAQTSQYDHIGAGGLDKPQADALYLSLTGGTVTGPITLPGAPTNALHAATRQYVDDNSGAITEPTAAGTNGRLPDGTWQRAVALAGDTMVGDLLLRGDPVLGLEAATKDYVDRLTGGGLPPVSTDDIFTNYGLFNGALNSLRQMGSWRTGSSTTNLPPGAAGNTYVVNNFNTYNEQVQEAYEFQPQAGSQSNILAIWVRKFVSSDWGQWIKTWPSYDQVGTDARYLQLTGGTITAGGRITQTAAPTLADHLANKAYVDRLLADATRYQGTWRVQANVPNLNPPTPDPVMGDRYVCLTDGAPGGSENAPAGMPGIGGQPLVAGDAIIWSAPLAKWEVIHATGLSKAEGDDLYLSLGGGDLTGPVTTTDDITMTGGLLTLANEPTDPMHAATRQFVLDSVAPGGTNFVDKGGDEMTGPLVMRGTPSVAISDVPFSAAIRITPTTRVAGERVLGFRIDNADGIQMAAFGASSNYNGAFPSGTALCYHQDGGSGFVEVWHSNTGGSTPTLFCTGPLSCTTLTQRNSLRAIKRDIEPVSVEEGAAAFNALVPSRFRMKEGYSPDPDKLRWGIMIDDIEAGAPDAITIEDGEKGFDVMAIVTIALAELKRQQAEIEDLKRRVLH
jgi:hypothetical protein